MIKKKLLLIVCLIMFSALSSANVEKDLIRLEEHSEIDSKVSLQLLRELELKFSNFENNNQRARFYIQKAYFNLLKLKNEQAKKTLFDLFKLKNIDQEHLVSAYHLLSQIDINTGDYHDAFKNLLKTIELLPETNSDKVKFSVLHSASNIFLQIEAFDEALANAERFKELAIELNSENDKCYAGALMAQVFLEMNDLKKSEKAILSAEPLCKLNNLNIVTVNILKSKGIYFFKLNQFKDSEKIFKEALKISELHPYKVDVLHIQSYLAQIYLLQRRFKDASQLSKSIVNDTKSEALSRRKKEAFRVLSEVSYNQGDREDAYNYLKKSNNLGEMIQNDLADKNLAYQKVKYAIEDKNYQIQILDQRNQLLELNTQVELQSKRNLQLIAIIVFFALALTAAGLWRVKRQKERYRELSEHDGLTGIYNRTHVLNVGQSSFVDSYNSGKDYSMINFDLDYFKAINDQYGHPFGDWLLSKVVNVCKQLIRSDDIFGRVGGEEFVVFLPNTSSENAHQLAQRCRQALAQIKHSQVTDEFSVTASFGVVTKRDDKQSFESFIKLADDAMYKAKRLGRNRVYVHQY